MAKQPLSVTMAAIVTAALSFAQPVSVNPNSLNPNSLVDGTRQSPQVAPEVFKPPPLSAEERGDILMARKMYREAIEAFSEGSPKDAVLRNKMGIANHQMMQLDSAKKCYEQAVKLKPNYAEAINNLGTIYYAQKSYRRAVSQYRKALKIQPESASMHSNLGTAYFARQQLKEMTEEFQIAMRLDPNVFEHHSSYGILLQERSVNDRAKFHYWMAALYAKDGRTELALQYLRKALEEGYKERKKLNEDPAFAGMRELPEFKLLLTLDPRVL
jgi:tetratricopeptide (TPR) repeat protein